MRHIYFTCDICDEEVKERTLEKTLTVMDGDYLFEKHKIHICDSCMEKMFGEEHKRRKKEQEKKLRESIEESINSSISENVKEEK
jgi:hypothetical protein